MEITKNIKEEQICLSKANADFREYAEANPGLLETANLSLSDIDDMQPCPTFVNQFYKNRFQEAAEKVFAMLKSLLKRVFNYDYKKISAYYEIPEGLAKLFLEGITDAYIESLVGRGDFILNPSELKCLEFNVTAYLGGMDVPVWESVYLNSPIMAKFLKENRVKIENDNLIQLFMNHVVRSTRETLPGHDNHGRMNILFVRRDYIHYLNDFGAHLKQSYKTLLRQQYPGLEGEVFVSDYHCLDFVDNFVYFKGKRIQALIELYHGIVSPEVMEVFKAGNIRLLNGPITQLLSNKLNMALLSDYKSPGNNVFSDEEKRIIDKYIPWSRKVIRSDTTYNGQKIDLVNFSVSHKDMLILKPSIGYGGYKVYVGREVGQGKWEELMDTALLEKKWLIQEYIYSSPALYQTAEQGCMLHDMVWGLFVLGARYGGAWARIIPQKDNNGVINCHQGAKVSVVLPVNE